MSHHVLDAAGILGCGLVAGVFFAFSGFIMPALGRLSAPQGISAMQAINIQAVTAPLMLLMFGTAGICLAIIVQAGLDWDAPGTGPRLSATCLYLVGVVGVTILSNVPRNNALAALDPHSVQAAAAWAAYLQEWTAWNSVRTGAAALAAMLLLASR